MKTPVFVPLALFLSTMGGTAACRAQQVTAAQTASSDSDAASSHWAVDMQKRRAELIARNGTGTDPALRSALLAMSEQDQAARGLAHGQPMNSGKLEAAAELAETDAALTAKLKQIVVRHGWPTIAMVGIDASNAAMVLLTHTRDHAWQLSLLPRLEDLARREKIDGSALALVVDKELVSEGKPQRYGTQFKVVDGQMAMLAVEDPEALDARRAMVFLPSMDEYKQRLVQMYHLPVSKTVASASR